MVSRSRLWIKISLALLFSLLLFGMGVPYAAAEETVLPDLQENVPVTQPEGGNPPAESGSAYGGAIEPGDGSTGEDNPISNSILSTDMVTEDSANDDVVPDFSREETLPSANQLPQEENAEKTDAMENPSGNPSDDPYIEANPSSVSAEPAATGSYSVTVSDGIRSMEFNGGTQVLLSDILGALGYTVTEHDEISVEQSSIDTSVVSVTETDSGLALSDFGPFSRASKNLVVTINGKIVELSLVDPQNIAGQLSVKDFADAMEYNGILTGDAAAGESGDSACILSEGVHDLYLNDKVLTLNMELRIPTGSTLNIYGGKDEISDGTGAVTGAEGITVCGGRLNVINGTINTGITAESGQLFIYGGSVNSRITTKEGSSTEIVSGSFSSDIYSYGGDICVYGGNLTDSDILHHSSDTGRASFFAPKVRKDPSVDKNIYVVLFKNNYYTSIGEALKDAVDGENILTLQADSSRDPVIHLTKQTELRINGKTLTGNIIVSGKVTISSNNSQPVSVKGDITVKSGGDLLITSTNVSGKLIVEEDTPDCVTKVNAKYINFTGCDIRGGYHSGDPSNQSSRNYLSDAYYVVYEGGQRYYEHHVLPCAARIGADTYFKTLQSALDACPDNTKTAITVLTNLRETIIIGANKNVELQLGGHTSCGTVTVNGGILAVSDGTVPGDSVITGGSLEYQNCKVDDVVLDKGTLKIDESTVTGNVTVSNDGICSVENSTVTGKLTVHSPDAKIASELSVFQGGCDLSGGIYSCSPAAFLAKEYAEYANDNPEYPFRVGNAAVQDGVRGYVSLGKALAANTTATLTLQQDLNEDAVIEAGKKITLNPESFQLKGTITVNGTLLLPGNQTVGGILKVNAPDACVQADMTKFSGWELTAGHYSSNPMNCRLSLTNAVYEDTENAEYPYRIGEAAAHDGNRGYASLQEALDRHKEDTGEFSVTLLNHTEEAVTITQNQIVLLDLNGHSITSAQPTALRNNGNLTLTDTAGSGTITGKNRGIEQNGEMTLAGHVKVTGNFENLYLFSGKNVTVAPGFDGEVGVTTEEKPSFASPISVAKINAEDTSRYFRSDEGQFELFTDKDILKLRLPGEKKTEYEAVTAPGYTTGSHAVPVFLIVEEIKEQTQNVPQIKTDATLFAGRHRTLSFIRCRLSNGVATGNANQEIIINGDLMKGNDASSLSVWYFAQDGTMTKVEFTVNEKGEIVITNGLLGLYVISI